MGQRGAVSLLLLLCDYSVLAFATAGRSLLPRPDHWVLSGIDSSGSGYKFGDFSKNMWKKVSGSSDPYKFGDMSKLVGKKVT